MIMMVLHNPPNRKFELFDQGAYARGSRYTVCSYGTFELKQICLGETAFFAWRNTLRIANDLPPVRRVQQ